MTPTQQKIYEIAKNSLGQHLTLDPNIRAETGCAEAVSSVLKSAGITGLPPDGFESTAAFYRWLLANPQFMLIEQPEQAAIVVSPTGFGNGTVEGHTGILGALGVQFANGFGIMSNNSDNGLWQDKWNLLTWWENYGMKGHLPVVLFRAL